ncbi:MAG: hypothetical protein PVF77_03535, partial [Anaerolineae bacterium]
GRRRSGDLAEQGVPETGTLSRLSDRSGDLAEQGVPETGTLSRLSDRSGDLAEQGAQPDGDGLETWPNRASPRRGR